MVNISYFSSKNILLIKYILSKISVKRVINMSDSSLLIAVSNLTLNNFCSFLIESMIPKRYSLVKDSFMLSSKLLFWSSVLVPSLSAFCFSNFSIFSIFSFFHFLFMYFFFYFFYSFFIFYFLTNSFFLFFSSS